jgi:dihydrolipoamide dehydrogenase
MAGVMITVVEFLDRILPPIDAELVKDATKALQALGIEILTGAKVTEITDKAVCYEKKDGTKGEVPSETVLMAVGRGPRPTGVDAEKLGIKMVKGAFDTDDYCKTALDNVYAIGDCNGKAMLAHVAMAEGVAVVNTICGKPEKMSYKAVPSVIYMQPEIASVGLTEEQAVAKYGKVNIGKFPLAGNGKAKVAGEQTGMVKVIAEPKYGEIVGVHIFGIHASDLIAESALAMNLECTAEEVAKSIHPHPSISEIMTEVMYAVNGKPIHF